MSSRQPCRQQLRAVLLQYPVAAHLDRLVRRYLIARSVAVDLDAVELKEAAQIELVRKFVIKDGELLRAVLVQALERQSSVSSGIIV